MSALLWVFTTTGGRQIFVKEILGGAYDSQAEHFLRGDVDVDVDAIRHESMIVKDKVRMYFGPFPAFVRIPLNFVYPAGYGKWSRIAGFGAGLIALFAFAGLVRTALCSSPLSSHARNWVGNACLIGFAFGSPLLLLLGNLFNLRRSHHLGICFVACRAVFCTACAMQRSYRPNARAAGLLPVCRWRPALASHVRLAFNPDCALSESGTTAGEASKESHGAVSPSLRRTDFS